MLRLMLEAARLSAAGGAAAADGVRLRGWASWSSLDIEYVLPGLRVNDLALDERPEAIGPLLLSLGEGIVGIRSVRRRFA